MEQVRHYWNEVSRYDNLLIPQYGKEIYCLCAGEIYSAFHGMGRY